VWGVVSDIHHNPGISLIVDPWDLFVRGKLDIAFESHSVATFSPGMDLIVLPHPTDRPKHPRTASSRQGRNRYTYTPLKEFRSFRLLEVRPGKRDDQLRGEITVHSATSLVKFRALSYTWGPNLKAYRLWTSEGWLPITAACESALRDIREPDIGILIWVDAICINQDDHHEKTVQIRLIREVFQSAEEVFGWIGEATDDSDDAIQTLLQIRGNPIAGLHISAQSRHLGQAAQRRDLTTGSGDRSMLSSAESGSGAFGSSKKLCWHRMSLSYVALKECPGRICSMP
jgi:hypothetical protein